MARDVERGRFGPGPERREHWYPEFGPEHGADWRERDVRSDRGVDRGEHPYGGDRQTYGQRADRPYGGDRPYGAGPARGYTPTRDDEYYVRGRVRHEPDLYPTFGDDYMAEYRDWAPHHDDDRRRVRGPFTGRGPRGYQRSNERIHEEVSDRLADHPWIDASQIEVSVDSGVVTLTGSVEDRTQKRMAEDVADSVAGVRDVQNQLRIEPALREPGTQRYSEQVITP